MNNLIHKLTEKFNTILRYSFFILLVRPLVKIIIGLRYHSPIKLPEKGKAIIVANHNSHLDTMVIISMMPLRLLSKVQPVAAADYFTKNRWMNWFAIKIIGILPIARHKGSEQAVNPIDLCKEALINDKILIFFPEGSRGEPEEMSELRYGITKLATECPDTPIYPVYLHGLGKVMPKGDAVLVPFFCDIAFSEPMSFAEHHDDFFDVLKKRFCDLHDSIKHPEWS